MLTTNLKPINQEECENLLRFYVKTGSNLFLYGHRGIGKSELSIQAIKACGYKVGLINLSVIDRPDLAGYPNLFEHADVVSYRSPYYLPALKKDAKPSLVLLLDDADKASKELYAPLHELLSTRTINGKALDIASVILTANLMNEGAGSNLIPSAVLDRGAKYELTFNPEQWFKWAINNGVHDLVVGFLKSNPNLICGDTAYTALASPTPRGWTMASEAIVRAISLKMNDENTIIGIVSGFVGEKVGTEFGLWYAYYRKYEPIALSLVEKDIAPSEWKTWSPTERMVFVITASRIARTKFVEASKTKPKYGVIERLCGWLEGVEPELQMLAISSFPAELVVAPNAKLYDCKPFFKLTQKLSGK